MTSLLQVKDLSITFATEAGIVTAVDKLSFDIQAGKTLGIVGESGCGKSVTCLGIMRLLPQPLGKITGGEVLLNQSNQSLDVVKLTREELRSIRGKKIAMIFQEPMTALNPVQTIGAQLLEVFELHFPEISMEDARKQIIDLLKQVGISDPDQRFNAYPHQLSGGMRQRVMIAMALACKPDVLIADEPTTALDVTIQAQILDLLKDLQKKFNMAMIFITHDLGVVAEMCDDVLVMYGGKAVEKGSAVDLFKNPSHPYTQGLISSLPKLNSRPKSTLQTIPGMVPPLNKMPTGCRFSTRCKHAIDICKAADTKEKKITASHSTWCVRHNELKGDL